MNSNVKSIARPGFTLLEMMASIAILTIVLLAAGSVMTLAARANINATNPNNPTNQIALARSAVDQMSDDLKMAKSFAARNATSVTFTVPDRTGDSIDETITYSWAGAGTPVMRQFNGAAPVSIADN